MNAYNTYHVHNQLAQAVRAAACLQEELTAQHCTLIGRFVRRLRHRWLVSSIDSLTWRLRGRY